MHLNLLLQVLCHLLSASGLQEQDDTTESCFNDRRMLDYTNCYFLLTHYARLEQYWNKRFGESHASAVTASPVFKNVFGSGMFEYKCSPTCSSQRACQQSFNEND